MSYYVGTLKESVAGLLTGTNVANITNLYGALERAGRTLAQKISLPTSSGRESIILYDNVFDYPAPDTIFASSITDLRPQGIDRAPWDFVYKTGGEQFDRTKGYLPNGYMVAFEYIQGAGIMRVSTPNAFPRAILDPMSATTGWVAAGSASAVVLDQTVYYEAPASLRSTLTGASTGTYTKTISTQNLSTYEDVGVVFLAIYTPSATNLTSITLRLGSSASAYDSVTATTGFIGSWIANDWTLVAFDFAGSASTGTPNWSAINHAQIRVTTAGTITNFRLGGMFIALPAPHEVLFDSAALFLTSGGSPSSTITADADLILVGDAAYTIYEYEAAKAVAMQMSGGVYTNQIKGFDEVLLGEGNELGLYARYRADNPSESLRQVGTYYDVRN